MSTITNLIGYRHDSASKSWKGAFFVGAFSEAAGKPEGHYELLGLDDIKKRNEAALVAGDTDAVVEYGMAQAAIEETIAGLRATPNDLPGDFQDKLFSESGGSLFKVIDPVRDVDWTEFQIAQKTAQVKAEFVPEGTIVETVMADGHVETKKTAKEGGGYRVTAQTGEQYLVDKAKFEKIYEGGKDGIYTPKPDPRKVVGLDKNVAFTAPWGEEMRIKEGGVLVHGGPKDVYGIQPAEFAASYDFMK